MKKYPYLYETHMHTSVGSRCAKNTPEEMVDAAKAMGYTGVFITDHNWGGNCAIKMADYSWEDYIRRFSSGYVRAKCRGDEIGLQVLWAYEAGFGGLGSIGTEVLVYGISPQWLIDHPEIAFMTLPEHCAAVRKEGALVVHAHPYRERNYIPEVRLFPDSVCAVEAVNAAHVGKYVSKPEPEFDEKALAYARAHNLPLTAGSDVHSDRLPGGGVAFPTRLKDEHDYCQRIMHRDDYILTNGLQIFDKYGDPISDPE